MKQNHGGKVKDESDVATVIGDVSITFPLAMIRALDELAADGLLKGLQENRTTGVVK